MWQAYYRRFRQYLQLERSLSGNSIEAYADDLKKLEQYSALHFRNKTPDKFSSAELEKFVQWLTKFGLSPASQARVISGIKAFYKFLLLEGDLRQSPSDLLETPRLGRKLPVFLTVEEIDRMSACIDRSRPEGERNASILETLYGCGLG